MGRPPIPLGRTGPVRYQVRQSLDGSWRSIALEEARSKGWTRARSGRAWRALQSVGTHSGTRAVSRIAPTHVEAVTAVEAVVEALVKELTQEPDAPTLGTMLEWVRERIVAGEDPRVRSPRTTQQYVAVLETWCGLEPSDERSHPYRTTITRTLMEDLTPGALNDELRRIAAEGGGSALRHVRAMWRKATGRALDLRLLDTDPAAGLQLPAATPRGKRVYSNGSNRRVDNALTANEEANLRRALATDERAKAQGVADLLLLSLETGARMSELAGIRWEDVGEESVVLTGQAVRIPKQGLTWLEGLKTGPDSREVPLTWTARTVFDRRRDVKPEDPEMPGYWLVFTSPRGGMPDPDNLASDVRETLDRAGLPWATVHTLRRTVENRLMSGGADPRLIERVMGHTSRTALRAYWDRNLDPADALAALESGKTHS